VLLVVVDNAAKKLPHLAQERVLAASRRRRGLSDQRCNWSGLTCCELPPVERTSSVRRRRSSLEGCPDATTTPTRVRSTRG
jgi:hypothetical protein